MAMFTANDPLAMVLACAGVVPAQGSTTPTTPAPEQQSSTANALPNGNCTSTTYGPPIPVMTRNLYLGADLSPVLAAASSGDPTAIVKATTDAWQHVNATNFPERAEAIADEIEQSEPLLVGLQEVSLFRTGPADTSLIPNATNVEYDYLDILLRALDERGLHYAVVTETDEADAETPGFTAPGVLQDIRLTDRDVILRRTDGLGSKLQLSNPQTGQYVAHASLPIGGTTPTQYIDLWRGWGSVDVTPSGQTFRFINTHLEQGGPQSDTSCSRRRAPERTGQHLCARNPRRRLQLPGGRDGHGDLWQPDRGWV